MTNLREIERISIFERINVDYILEGITFGEDLSNFSLSCSKHFSGMTWLGIYRDTPYSLEFYSIGENMPSALVGFRPTIYNFIIFQIQARKGIGKENLPKKWERILLEAAINFADDIGCENVSVVSAESNKWYVLNCVDDNCKNFPGLDKRLKMRYDVTSKRRGFNLDGSFWVLPLNQRQQ